MNKSSGNPFDDVPPLDDSFPAVMLDFLSHMKPTKFNELYSSIQLYCLLMEFIKSLTF